MIMRYLKLCLSILTISLLAASCTDIVYFFYFHNNSNGNINVILDMDTEDGVISLGSQWFPSVPTAIGLLMKQNTGTK